MIVLDEEIAKAVKYQLGDLNQKVFEEQDLEKIQELNLNNHTFLGENKNINLYNLDFFSNLRILTLQYFDINNDIVNLINSCKNLRQLQLSSCNCSFDIELKNDRLDNLFINCCKVNNYSKINAPRIFSIVGDSNLNLIKLNGKEKVQSLSLLNCKINNFKAIHDFKQLVILNLDGSVVDNEKLLENISTKVKRFSKLDKYLPIG